MSKQGADVFAFLFDFTSRDGRLPAFVPDARTSRHSGPGARRIINRALSIKLLAAADEDAPSGLLRVTREGREVLRTLVEHAQP